MRAVAADQPAVPRHARPFVAAFLLAIVVCALVPFNPWPFSDWELFSRLRSDRQTAWEAVAVESSGRTVAYPVGSLPRGYRGFASTMTRFSARSQSSRDAACETWIRAASTELGAQTSRFRIYEVSWLLSGKQGHRRAPRSRALEWTCSARGARAG